MANAELPPGQREINWFPRFGIDFGRPAPAVPSTPAIEVTGLGIDPVRIPLERLGELPRRTVDADFHCVSGWSYRGLQWEGVGFSDFFGAVVEPLVPGSEITHVSFEGADGYRSVARLEDVMDDDVLLADRLGGEPLSPGHGAPIRLLSPKQYGFVSTKHLCRIELHSAEPAVRYHPSLAIHLGLTAVKPHERARVWEEERHRHGPNWLVRPVYHRLGWLLRRLRARAIAQKKAASAEPSRTGD